MRFMVMHKMTEEMEKGLPPELAIIEGVGRLIGEGVKEKVFVSGEGLKPSSQRVHIAYKNGKRTITDSPFTEAKELVAGFALMRVRSKEEAISWCDKFAAVIGDVELFMGPVNEPWDLGMVPSSFAAATAHDHVRPHAARHLAQGQAHPARALRRDQDADHDRGRQQESG